MGFALERIDSDGAERALAGLELMGRPRAADLSSGEQQPGLS
jgi:hydrogenase expression/formation protein HypC